MIDYISWAIALAVNLFFFIRLLRQGPGNPRDARIGRDITLVLLLIATLFATYNLANGAFVLGSVCVVLVGIYAATVAIVNRYLDEESEA